MSAVESQTLTSLEQLRKCQSRALWLQDETIAHYRQQALERYIATGLPTRRNERWKYAQLDGLNQLGFVAPLQSDRAQSISVELLSNTISIVLLDGQIQPHLSTMDALPAGVSVTSLSDLSLQQLQYYQEKIALLSESDRPFTQLNIALCHVGFLLHIEAGVHCLPPIEILHLHTQDQAPVQQQSHHMICLEPGAQAVVFERYQSSSEEVYFRNVLLQIDLADQSNLTYYKLQNENCCAHHISNTMVYQQEFSRFSGLLLAAGSSYSRDQLDWQLMHCSAECQWKALVAADQSQQLEVYTQASHLAAQCQSKQELCTLASDRAKVTCHNTIYVEPSAHKTDAKLHNRNVLLSDQVKVNTKPALEIYHDDVKCAHGATIGRLDDEALFYLQARGLSLSQARAMLLDALVSDVLTTVSSEAVREVMSSAIKLSFTAMENDDG